MGILDSSTNQNLLLLLQETMDLKFVLILVSMATFSQGLKCYQGGLIYTPWGEMVNDTMKEKECRENEVCYKQKFVALDSHGYGCDYPNVWFKTFDDNPPQPPKEECVETTVNNKEVHVCICTTDLCNNP